MDASQLPLAARVGGDTEFLLLLGTFYPLVQVADKPPDAMPSFLELFPLSPSGPL